jgi:hypothetical protein
LEIKELESDMQMLVYENYNKFISATDTIQEMKNKVLSAVIPAVLVLAQIYGFLIYCDSLLG